MQFYADHEMFDTREMITIEVDSFYLTVYVDSLRRMAFIQTFEDDLGVQIRKASPDQTQSLLALVGASNLPDSPARRAFVRQVLEARRRLRNQAAVA